MLKVKLGLREQRRKENGKVCKEILNPDMFKNILSQRVLRELANENESMERMIA